MNTKPFKKGDKLSPHDMYCVACKKCFTIDKLTNEHHTMVGNKHAIRCLCNNGHSMTKFIKKTDVEPLFGKQSLKE